MNKKCKKSNNLNQFCLEPKVLGSNPDFLQRKLGEKITVLAQRNGCSKDQIIRKNFIWPEQKNIECFRKKQLKKISQTISELYVGRKENRLKFCLS